MAPTNLRSLPLPAQCALEYLEAQGFGNRTAAKLNGYLDHYFKVYGQTCDAQLRAQCTSWRKRGGR